MKKSFIHFMLALICGGGAFWIVCLATEEITAQENVTEWKSGQSGSLLEGSNWVDGIGLSADRTGWRGVISGGAPTISNFENGNETTLEVTGDTVLTISGTAYVGNRTQGHGVFSGNAKITATGGIQLAADSSLSQTDGSEGSTLTLKENAVFNVRGNFVPARNSPATLYLQDNAELNFNGGGVCVFGEFSSGGVCEMTGGRFNINVASSAYDNGLRLGRNSRFNQSGGVVNVGTSAVVLPLSMNNDSSYYLSDKGILNITGELIKSASNFHFTGGTLSATTIRNGLNQQGGILSPGIDWSAEGAIAIGTTTIQGVYTLDAGGVQLELTNDNWDTLSVTGKSKIADDILLDIVLAEDFLFQSGDSYAIWNSAGGFELPENLEGLLAPEVGYYWNLSASGNQLILSVDSAAIPEPGTWGMLLFGIFCGYGVWRKKWST